MSLKLCHLLFNDGAALKATCRVFVKKGIMGKSSLLWFFWKTKWECNNVIMLLGNKLQRQSNADVLFIFNLFQEIRTYLEFNRRKKTGRILNYILVKQLKGKKAVKKEA